MRNICLDCSKEVASHNKLVVRCSSCRSKYMTGRKGELSNAWKGGKWMSKGYYWVSVPNHPYAKRGSILEHRHIMEKKIGRYLNSWEVVHHINGVKSDNRVENLMLVDKSEHALIHIKDKIKFTKNNGGKWLTCISCKRNVWKNKYYIENKYSNPKNLLKYLCKSCGGGGRKVV